MNRHLTRTPLQVLLALFLALPVFASIAIAPSSNPIAFCPTSTDTALGEVGLATLKSGGGTVPAGAIIQLTLPAPLSATAAPAVFAVPAVAGLVLSSSGNVVLLQFTATVALPGGQQFNINGLRVDATQIQGVNAFVMLGSNTVGSSPPFSFTFLSPQVLVGIADATLCPPAPVTLVLNHTSLNFRAIPNVIPNNQSVGLMSTDNRLFTRPVITVSTTDGAAWLSAVATNPFGPDPSNAYLITVSVNQTGLAPGVYTGQVSLAVANATNSPLAISVTLTVTDGPLAVNGAFLPNSNVLVFRTVAGADPDPQQITVTAPSAVVALPTVSALVQTPAGTNWLTFTTTTTQNSAQITVQPKVAGLAPSGITPYTGSIRLTSNLASNSPADVGIQLFVTSSTPQISLSQPKLTFTVPASAAAQVSQNLAVKNVGGGSLVWSAQASTDRGGSWLSINPANGTGDVSIVVNVDPTGLAPGAYTGSIAISSSGAFNSPQQTAVTLLVGDVPFIADNGIKEAASFSGGPEAAGSILALFGSNLAGSSDGASSLPLPTVLGSTQVKVNGTPAPLFYSSSRQINFELPPDVTGNSVNVVVSRNGVDGLAVDLPLAPASPGLFTQTSDGQGAGVILNAGDSSLVSPSNPAKRGSVIVLYGTGLGPVNPAVAAGQPALSDPLSRMTLPAQVTIGGLDAKVLYQGLAPFFVGLYQLNVEVPAGVAPGSAVPVTVSVNSTPSNTVSLAVQ